MDRSQHCPLRHAIQTDESAMTPTSSPGSQPKKHCETCSHLVWLDVGRRDHSAWTQGCVATSTPAITCVWQLSEFGPCGPARAKWSDLPKEDE
jgi:hypothetical protein